MSLPFRRAIASVATVVGVLAASPRPAAAQTGSTLDLSGAFRGERFDRAPQPTRLPVSAPTPPRRRQSWTTDLHIGLVPTSAPVQGAGTLPPAGADFLAADGLLTSPAVSSWFFGNG